jgi:DNA-binding NarL/FixJ family response regulator
MIRVVVVDDQTLVRHGIRSLLSLAEGIEVAGEAADGVEALETIARLQPDVVLLDVRMPRMDGLAVLEALGEREDDAATLMLTTFDDDEALMRALRLGASGYLLKDASLERLVDAIRTVADGRTMIRPALTDRIVRGLASDATDAPPDGVDPPATTPERPTERELEILRLMVAGWSNKRIARGLDLAEGTVKNHVSTLLAKLGVRDRTRAVLRAIEEGIVD